MRQHNIIFDPIAFKGGSKIATSEALSLCSGDKTHFTVITVDREYWLNSTLARKHPVKVLTLTSIPWLREQVHGPLYWLKQLYLAAALLCYTIVLRRCDKLIAASGPGVDMPVYLLALVMKAPVIQFIHGNVACSGSIGWCLTRASRVFFLPSAKQSMHQALCRYFDKLGTESNSGQLATQELEKPYFHSFVNGISDENWPSRSQVTEPKCLWAASLLRWKGLEHFIAALHVAHKQQPIHSTICYIKPKQIKLGISPAPVPVLHTKWYCEPENLDHIRTQCSIFVSTSENEPFGLSILEALAAGLCVVIPKDNSYWDTQLSDGINCIKYAAGDAADLARALLYAQQNPLIINTIRTQSLLMADNYRAADCYREIVDAMSQSNVPRATDMAQMGRAKKELE